MTNTTAATIMVTIVIPAYNEEANIVRVMRQVLDEPWGNGLVLGRVVVVDDCSADSTLDMAKTVAGTDSRVQVVHNARRSGKNVGVRAVAKTCCSDVMAVVDADVLLDRGCLVRTIEPLRDNLSLMASSCIIEPLPSRSWRERASRSQALLVSELKRLGYAYLSAVYVLRSPAFGALEVPDGVADDAYITCWLRAKGYRYTVRSDATAYIRAATGLRDFAKQTLRGRHGAAATRRAVANSDLVLYRRSDVARAIFRAFRRDPLGFTLYAIWYGIVIATPTKTWLPVVNLSVFDAATSTKDMTLSP